MLNPNQPGQPRPVNLNVDISKIPDMKCWCGHEEFIQVYRLRFVSPMLCGHQTGMSVNIMQYECRNCAQRYPEAWPQEKINALRQSKLDSGEITDEG
jgi:hypothetical protein